MMPLLESNWLINLLCSVLLRNYIKISIYISNLYLLRARICHIFILCDFQVVLYVNYCIIRCDILIRFHWLLVYAAPSDWGGGSTLWTLVQFHTVTDGLGRSYVGFIFYYIYTYNKYLYDDKNILSNLFVYTMVT